MTTSAQGTVTQGRPVALETERLKLRSLSPVDASERWLGWVRDPDVMHPTNMPARRMTRQELANQIASHDNYHRFLIGVFDKASARYAATRLAEEGATIGVVVDGGTSSTMAIGSDARGVRTGTITGNWRPVATVFGFRASSK